MKKPIYALLIGLSLYSCSPKVKSKLANSTFPAIEAGTPTFVLDENENIPENSIFIGDLKIGDSGFSTDCGYETVMENAKLRAKKSGANLILLTETKEPNAASTCYRIKAKMYRNLDEESLANFIKENNQKNESRLPSDADYAVIYFYRPKNFTGSAIGYKIKLENDSIIGRVRNGEKFEYKTSTYGMQSFWGATESKDSVVINVKKGQEYFVRCGMNMGVFVGRPKMRVVSNITGIREYEEME